MGAPDARAFVSIVAPFRGSSKLMLDKLPRVFVLALTLGCASSLTLGCEEKKEEKKPLVDKPPVDEPEPAPIQAEKAPNFSVDDVGPLVGFSRVMVTLADGKPAQLGVDQLKKELEVEKSFISGKDLVLNVHRKAKPEFVSLYLEELAALGANELSISTETRDGYPKQVKFAPGSAVQKTPPCTLVGAITEDFGTAIWRVEGGTARKRQRGMGGPDLTITGDTILSLAKTCTESDLFIVHAAPTVEWGLIYDLAASGMILEKAGLKRAALPSERPTPGRPVVLSRK